MLQNSDAISVNPNGVEVELGLPLVIVLPGEVDAGRGAEQVANYFKSEFNQQDVALFRHDKFLNYREHRPSFSVAKNSFRSYAPPQIKLNVHEDEVGKRFFLLSGFEPDFNWDRFVLEVRRVCEAFGIKDVFWFQSIPFPVPHTRDITVLVSGNRDDVISKYHPWLPHEDVPASASSLIEYRLLKWGFNVSGFTLLTPHYVSDVEMPQVPLRIFEVMSAAIGLVIPTDRIRAGIAEFNYRLDVRTKRFPDLPKLVRMLEIGFDKGSLRQIKGVASRRNDSPESRDVAADIEEYLSNLSAKGDSGDGETQVEGDEI